MKGIETAREGTAWTEDELRGGVRAQDCAETLHITLTQLRERRARGTFPPIFEVSQAHGIVRRDDWEAYLAGKRDWGYVPKEKRRVGAERDD